MSTILLILSLTFAPVTGVDLFMEGVESEIEAMEEMSGPPLTEKPFIESLPEEIREQIDIRYGGLEIDEALILKDVRAINPDFKWEDLTAPLPEGYENTVREWREISSEYEKVLSGESSFEEIEARVLDSLKSLSIDERGIGKVFFLGNPVIDGITMDEIFKVTEVTVGETVIRSDGREDINKLLIRGMGPPDSTVFLFVYSTPIIVSAKTNHEGRWSYLLDKELEDGNHEIYVATADETGKIVAKNSPVPFVKEAASVKTDLTYFSEGDPNALGFFEGKLFSILAIIFILVVTTTIILIGVSIERKRG